MGSNACALERAHHSDVRPATCGAAAEHEPEARSSAAAREQRLMNGSRPERLPGNAVLTLLEGANCVPADAGKGVNSAPHFELRAAEEAFDAVEIDDQRAALAVLVLVALERVCVLVDVAADGVAAVDAGSADEKS